VGQFGDKFRKAREAKGISLDDVSNVTKIGSRMLQAIEQEHFDQLPGGVFNKGFIRAYAKHLGLNDEDAVTDYLACLRQAQVDAHEVWDPAPQPVASAPERRPIAPYRKPTLRVQPAAEFDELPDLQLPRAEDVHPPKKEFLSDRNSGTPWSLVAVTAVILVLAIVLWARHSRGARTHAISSPSKPVPTVQSAPATTLAAPTPAAAKPASAKSPAKSSPANSLPANSASTNSATNPPAAAPQSRPPQPAPSTAPTITAKLVATAPVKPPSTPQEKSPEKDVISRTLLPANPPPANPTPATTTTSTPAPAPMTLVIRANETSWIAVTADGQAVSQETLIAPVHTSFHATRQIIARIGNAAGVTFIWNGQEIPAQGAEYEVKTILFDASGMRILPSPQPTTQNQ